MSNDFRRIGMLLGVPLDISENVAEALSARMQKDGLTTVVTPNPEILMTTLNVLGYQDTLAEADVSLPDGNGLFWATTFLEETQSKKSAAILLKFVTTYACLVFAKRALRKVLPRIHHGSDTFFALHDLWNRTMSPRIFYFGGEDGVPEQIIPAMQQRYPHLNLVGSCGGYPFRSELEFEDILKHIEKTKPEVVFVALPFPKQEQWIMQTRGRLELAGVKLVCGFGGTLDFAVGKKKRAPVWMHRLGIEWLWRLIHEPERFGRIWSAVVRFPLTILRHRLAGRQDWQRL